MTKPFRESGGNRSPTHSNRLSRHFQPIGGASFQGSSGVGMILDTKIRKSPWNGGAKREISAQLQRFTQIV